MENNQQSTSFGSILGIIIVITVLLIGGYYFVQQRIQKSAEFQSTLQEQMTTTTPASDEISDIEKDANAIDTSSLGAGIDSL
jgi:uncharacterized protein HemX